MTEAMLTYRGMVYPWQCDHMGHMNVQWYVAKFDEACWQFLSSAGISTSRMQQTRARMAAVVQHIEYKRELFPGDVISIRSKMLDIGEKSVRMQHVMVHDESREVVAIMEVVGVHVDFNTKKASPLPADVRERMTAMIGERSLEIPT